MYKLCICFFLLFFNVFSYVSVCYGYVFVSVYMCFLCFLVFVCDFLVNLDVFVCILCVCLCFPCEFRYLCRVFVLFLCICDVGDGDDEEKDEKEDGEECGTVSGPPVMFCA